VQGREALPVSQADIVTRREAVSYTWDIAVSCSVVEFLTTFAIHADSLTDHTRTSARSPSAAPVAADVSALAICRGSGDSVRLWMCSPFLHSSGRSARVMNQKAARLDRSATTAGSTLWREVTVLWLAGTLLA